MELESWLNSQPTRGDNVEISSDQLRELNGQLTRFIDAYVKFYPRANLTRSTVFEIQTELQDEIREISRKITQSFDRRLSRS